MGFVDSSETRNYTAESLSQAENVGDVINRLRAEMHALDAIVGYHADAQILKSPYSMISVAIRPLSFLFLLIIVSGGELLTTAIIGAMVTFFVGFGLADVPLELAGMKRRSQFFELFRSLPLSGPTLAVGTAVGLSLPGLFYGGLLLGVLIFLYELGPVSVGFILALCVLVWIWGVLTGYVIGVWLEKLIHVRRATSAAVVITTTLAPVYYPVELLPDTIEQIALLAPPASGAYLLRFVIGEVPFRLLPTIVLALAVILSVALAAYVKRY